MPIADLLGVRFDMQLLAKLTVSAAAIIFVTWVFRFYSNRNQARARAKKRLPPPKSIHPSPETCNPCKTVLEPLKEREKEEYDGTNQSSQSSDSGQGILQPQKTDAMVEKEEKKEFETFVANTEGSSSLSSAGECSTEVEAKSEDIVTNAEGSSSLFSAVERNTEVQTKSEDIVTNAEGSSSLSSAVERNTEVQTKSEDIVTNAEESSSLSSAVERNTEVQTKSEDIVTNAEGSSSLSSAVERNTEVQTKSEDIVTNAEESSSLSSAVERNTEVQTKSEDIVTNAEESSSLSSAVERNTEVQTNSEDIVTNAEGSSSLSSAMECNTEVDKQSEDFVASAKENSSPSSGAERSMKDFRDKTDQEIRDYKAGLTRLTPGSDVNVATSPSGRRSPCQLKKMDGGVEVGRELMQNMGQPGTFSSFQSKAEIKVENANLVIEGPGDRSTAVHGKIYDYFVETSSQSVSDLSPTHSISPTYAPYEANTLPNVMDKPRTPSPLPSSFIMRDVESSNDSDMLPQAPIRSETGRLLRHGLIRKDSYLAAAAESELQIPFPPPLTRSRSPALLNEHSANSPRSPKQIQESGSKSSEDPQVKTLARAQFFHFPTENIGNSELESLTGKLDLGNCLEALMLAKKHGHNALYKAALTVMSDNYFQVLRDPNLYGQLKAGERDQIQKQRKKGRRFLMVADMDSPDWTRSPSQSTDSYTVKGSSGLYYYEDYKDTWHLQCQIPQEVLSKGCAMCTMDNYLFVAVGFQCTVPSRKVFSYNPITSIWSEICPMNEARPHCKLVALEDHVYAIGGECLSTVERYDPRTNRWTFVAPLPNETFAVAHRATACNGELFVSGGTLKYTLLRYNPKTDVWRKSLIVGSKERTTEMVAVRNFLYRFDVNPYLGISVYRYHVVARIWYECCSKQIQHCPAFQCIAMDDVIYCVSRQFTMRFLVDEKYPGFVADDLQILTPAKGILFPFVLTLPDKSTLQTSV
ncbi:kelch domain-containing protein 7A [Neoarius graeffei]|uniref:kelch domain-containing protein 7A n=1 Tax=Neoarius graeffei TaxID=443677 RepID=UPI00298CDD44|nr:kelch domain-containing protein 7A [Neoarius graeffei]